MFICCVNGRIPKSPSSLKCQIKLPVTHGPWWRRKGDGGGSRKLLWIKISSTAFPNKMLLRRLHQTLMAVKTEAWQGTTTGHRTLAPRSAYTYRVLLLRDTFWLCDMRGGKSNREQCYLVYCSRYEEIKLNLGLVHFWVCRNLVKAHLCHALTWGKAVRSELHWAIFHHWIWCYLEISQHNQMLVQFHKDLWHSRVRSGPICNVSEVLLL